MAGCLTTQVSRVGGDLSVSKERVGGDLTVTKTRVGGDLTVRVGLVCGTNIGLGFLYASDGLLITIDGGKLIVQQ